MNPKNLPLKFAAVGLMVLVCIWSLWANRLQLGIDLRGGHSLVFEIRTNEAEAAGLHERLAGLEEELKTAPDDQKAQVQERIGRVRAELQRFEGGWNEGDLANKMIAILKRRVDPQGLRSLEWRPLGTNRLEIRMPAASPQTQQARYEYFGALDKLERANIQRSDIRRIVQAGPPQRPAEIAAVAGGDEGLAGMLLDLTAAYDVVEQARARLSAAATGQQRQEAGAALANAEFDYDTLLKGILRTNVNLQSLQAVLANYVPPTEEKAIGSTDEVARRRSNFDAGVKAIIKQYPQKQELIEQVVGAYKNWAQGRQRLEDPADLKRLIAKAGVLEFRVAPFRPRTDAPPEAAVLTEDQAERYLKSLQDEGPEALRQRGESFLWFPTREDPEKLTDVLTDDYQGMTYVLLANTPDGAMLHEPGAGGWSLTSSRPDYDSQGRPAVSFTFNDAGAQRFNRLTGAHVGDWLAVLLDDEMYSVAKIRSAISRSGIIEGNFSLDEVRELVRTLEAGSLPARLNPDPVAENTFGPGMGEENLKQALRAGWISLIVVCAFMLVYYMKAGLLADAALMLNLVLVLGAMSLLNAVFTLPGIAGVILTIGMAVDANVLIYERLREEQQKGQSPRMAVKNAYDRALSAIIDSNLTTLLTCVILGWVATEEVKGFAITLGLGVVFNIFTAVVVTRWFFQLMLERGWMVKPLAMMKVIGVPKIDWMAKRYWFWTLSTVVSVLGVVSLVWQGSNIWGIEFSSGTQVVVDFRSDALLDGQLPNDALVRTKVIQKAQEAGMTKFVATARVEKIIEPNQVREFLQAYAGDDNADRVTLAQWERKAGNVDFFRRLDPNGDGVVTREELKKDLPATSYQISTTETDVAKIRRLASETFGQALVQRSKVGYQLLTGEQAEGLLGVSVAGDGMTKIDKRLLDALNPEFRQGLEDFTDGVLLVIGQVDPPVTREEMLERIREMRFQPDFAAHQLNQTTVMGLGPSQDQRVSAFAVAAMPNDPAVTGDSAAWDKFAAGETALLHEALGREQALVATNFDPAIAGEIAQSAIVAVILSWIAIVLYLWLRFGSSRWGLAAVICLIHDVTIAVGLVAVSGWLSHTAFGKALLIGNFKIDLALVAAFLTIIGYSVNDTIVVFDRIRENRGKLATVTSTVINNAINQTLSRTLLTGTATLLVVLIMYIWGGEGMHAFNFVLLVGILFGTYSSIAVASPLLMGFRRAILTRALETPAPVESRR